MEKQNTFGWPIAAAVFLGGAGGGAFLISFIMDILGKYQPIARIGAVAGPVLVILCTVFLISDLGSKFNFYRLFGEIRSSWMSRGTLFITVFVILGLAYSVPSFWIPWGASTTPGLVIGAIAALFSFLVILYTGVVFGVVKRIPLWNTPALPLLFIFSALSTGMSVLVLIAAFSATGLEEIFSASVPVEVSFVLMELVILGAYMEIVRQAGTVGTESVRLLLNPWFIIAVICAGLIIPLGLLAYTGLAVHTLVLPILSSVLILIGGFFLRYYIIASGIRLPIYPY